MGLADEHGGDRWGWTRAAWHEAFQVLVEAGYELERVERGEYWRAHEAELRRHFPAEVFFDTRALRSEAERAGQERLEAARGEELLRDCAMVRRGGELVAMFTGHQGAAGTYRMHHTHVHPDFRRRGVYTCILRGVIGYTRALGFDGIGSEHALCNNAVLIAKLRAGFRIYGFDMDPMVGPSVLLRYFHNPDHLAAYEYRCGYATMNRRLLEHGSGAMPLLIAQFRGDEG